MKAYSLKAINDLVYTDYISPDIKDDWCLVKVKVCGICSSDIPRIYKKGTYNFPTIPGHEFSGIVVKVAKKENFSWIGKKVGVFPLIPCNNCDQCIKKNYEMCENYDYIGSRRDGAFAEYVAVPIWNLIELPELISYHEAALLEPIAVALHAVKKANIQPKDSVAIIGTGMIAFCAAQCSKLYGAKYVTVIGRNYDKAKFVDDMDDIIYTVNDVSNYDIVIEAVGSNQTINQSISISKPGGKVVLIGNPEGDIYLSQDQYWKILRKQLTLIGTWNSTYNQLENSDWSEVIDAIIHKRIKVSSLISHIFPQDKLIDALELMHKHKEPFCKVLIDWDIK